MMIVAPFRVLLLGWNEASRPGEATVPSVRPLVGQLAPLTSLAVMLPHLPYPAFAAGPGLRVTGLADLNLTDALAPRPRPEQRPAAWQRPAAPYSGTATDGPGYTAPAAPYQGATPQTVAALPAEEVLETPVARLQEELLLPAPPTPANIPGLEPSGKATDDLLLNRDEFAQEAEPEAGEARELDEFSDEPVPSPPPMAPSPARVQATLTEALAALGMDLPATSDLNFQVIQYARFATRRAFQEDFAVIYAVDWPTWLAGMEIRQQTGRPLVLHVHDLAQERDAASGWGLALERLALRRADLVLAASDEVANLLYERYQLPPERLRTVAPTDTETVNAILHQLETNRPGHPAIAPLFPPTA